MGLAIATNEIGGDLYCQGDVIFSAESIASIGTVTSSEFLFAQTMGAQEIKVVADNAITVASGETITVAVQTATATGGSFATVASVVIPASSIAADDVIFKYVSPREVTDIYTKLTVTTTAVQTGDTVSAYIVGVC